MPEQARLPFPRRRPSRSERLEAENLAAARAILEKPETYGAGLVLWAKRTLATEESHAGDPTETR